MPDICRIVKMSGRFDTARTTSFVFARLPMDAHPEPDFSRRDFLTGVTVAGIATTSLPLLPGLSYPAGPPAPGGSPMPGSDFTRQSAALQPDKIVDSACQFCNSLCRLKVHLKDGRVIDIRGEPDDPVQAGGLCVKGPMMAQLVYNRFRLTKPLKRVGGEKGSPDSKFEPMSWDEALDDHREEVPRPARRRRGAGDRQQDLRPAAARHRLAGRPALRAARQSERHRRRPGLQRRRRRRAGLDVRPGQFHQRLRRGRRDRQAKTSAQRSSSSSSAPTRPRRIRSRSPICCASRQKTEGQARRHRSAADADRRAGRRVDRPEAAHRPGPRAGDACSTSSRRSCTTTAFVAKWVVGFDELEAHLAGQRLHAGMGGRRDGMPAATIRSWPSNTPRRSPRRSSATPASRTNSAPSTPIARSPSWRRSPATSACTAAAATSCTTPGPAA